jgi:hypothetical protein
VSSGFGEKVAFGTAIVGALIVACSITIPLVNSHTTSDDVTKADKAPTVQRVELDALSQKYGDVLAENGVTKIKLDVSGKTDQVALRFWVPSVQEKYFQYVDFYRGEYPWTLKITPTGIISVEFLTRKTPGMLTAIKGHIPLFLSTVINASNRINSVDRSAFFNEIDQQS